MDWGRSLLVVVAVLAFIFIATSTGGSVWVKRTQKGEKRTYGLWRECRGRDSLSCKWLEDRESWQSVAQVLSTFACISSGFAILTALCGFRWSKRFTGVETATLLGGACAWMLIVLGMFGQINDWTSDAGGYTWGWSMIVGWFAAAISGVGVVMGICARNFDDNVCW